MRVPSSHLHLHSFSSSRVFSFTHIALFLFILPSLISVFLSRPFIRAYLSCEPNLPLTSSLKPYFSKHQTELIALEPASNTSPSALKPRKTTNHPSTSTKTFDTIASALRTLVRKKGIPSPPWTWDKISSLPLLPPLPFTPSCATPFLPPSSYPSQKIELTALMRDIWTYVTNFLL